MTNVSILTVSDAQISNREVCAFYKTHWARPIALVREDFCDWQMNQAPDARGENHSVAALVDDEIVAIIGATPARFGFAGESYTGAELTTWVVAPQSRGKGVGKRILAYLQDQYDVLAGGGITGAALPLYLGAGFTFLAHIPRFFYVADFNKIKVFTEVSEAARRVQMQRQSKAEDLRWKAESVPAAALTFAGNLSGYGHFCRSSERLAWRHDQHPAFKYEAFFVHDESSGGPGAGVILREDCVEQTKILHVIDLFGEPAHIGAAIAFIENEAARRGTAFVDISLTAGPLIAQLRARGWSSAIDDPLIEMPSLFHPVELRRPPTTSMVIWGREKRAQLYDFSRLHITRADMDLDRPTLHWYENGQNCNQGTRT